MRSETPPPVELLTIRFECIAGRVRASGAVGVSVGEGSSNEGGRVVMAAPRKSAQQVKAREKARAKAQELTERHEKLIDLAAGYFEQQDQAEQIRTEAQERADQILAKAEDDAASALAEAGAKVQQMLDTGESRAAVAARLGLSSVEVKRALDGAGTSTGSGTKEDEAASTIAESADEVADQVRAETTAV